MTLVNQIHFLRHGTVTHIDKNCRGVVAVSAAFGINDGQQAATSEESLGRNWKGCHTVFDSGVACSIRSGDVVVTKQFQTTVHGSTWGLPGRWAITVKQELRLDTDITNYAKGTPLKQGGKWELGPQAPWRRCECQHCKARKAED